MIRALVITHGNIGAELVRVTGLILGPVEGLAALSNSGRSLADLRAAITAWLAEGAAAGADRGADPGRRLRRQLRHRGPAGLRLTNRAAPSSAASTWRCCWAS